MYELIKAGKVWSLYYCDKCNEVFTMTSEGNKQGKFCLCYDLIKNQSKGISIIYILSNKEGLFKIGLSTKGKTFDKRLKSINRGATRTNLSQFNIVYVKEYKSRVFTNTIERLLHSHFKSEGYRLFEYDRNNKYVFEGQGEIYKDIEFKEIIKLINILENRINYLKYNYLNKD